MKICITIIALLVLIIIFLIYKLYNAFLCKELKNEVAWCVSNDHLKRGCLTLLEHINNVESDVKYKIIDESEKKIANEILKCYKNELIQNYFNDNLIIIQSLFKKRYFDSGEEYFFISLSNFLRKHECEVYFDSKKMYTLKSKKTYGYYGGELYDTIYELTDVGKVYHKLYYLSQSFCAKHEFSSIHAHASNLNVKVIQQCIDNNEIKISRV